MVLVSVRRGKRKTFRSIIKVEGRGYGKCEGSNWCVYISGESCSTQNTGNTAVKPKPGTNPGCQEGKCGWQWAAGGRLELDRILKMISVMIIIMTGVE